MLSHPPWESLATTDSRRLKKVEIFVDDVERIGRIGASLGIKVTRKKP
jgi:hypothetical protein